MLRPVYAGLRSINPEIEGQWEHLVPPSDFYAVQAIFAARTRSTPRPGAKNVNLVSGIGRCGVCGGKLNAKPRNGVTMYSCGPRSCVAVPLIELDLYVTEVVLAYLATPGMVEELTAPPSTDAELATVLNEKHKPTAELAELERGVKAGKISPFIATASEEGIRSRLAAAEAREKELCVPSPLRALLAPLRDGDARATDTVRALIESNWTAAETSAKREALRVLLSADMIGELRVNRSPVPRQRCPVEDRAKFRTATRDEG